MKKEEFAWHVLNVADDGLPVGALRGALREFAEDREPTGGDVGECLSRARKIAGGTIPPPLVQLVPLPVTPLAEASHAERLRALEPWTGQLRRELFGRAAPPFKSNADIECWLSTEDLKTSEGCGHWRELPYVADRRRARMRVLILPANTDGTGPLDLHVGRAEGGRTAGKGGHASRVAQGTGGWRLAEATAEMSRASGVPQVELVRLVLLAERPRPAMPRPEIRYLPSHEALSHPELGRYWVRRIRVDLEEYHVTRDLFAEVFRALRRALGKARRKSLTEEDAKLLRLVRKLGDPPQRSYRDYWERASEIWESHGGERITYRALRMRYARLVPRLRTKPGLVERTTASRRR